MTPPLKKILPTPPITSTTHYILTACRYQIHRRIYGGDMRDTGLMAIFFSAKKQVYRY